MPTTRTEPRIAFLIGGVQKGGTSALARYLSAHPGIRLPTGKEAHVFDAPDFPASASVTEINALYAPHFADHRPDALHGDATPFYLFRKDIVAQIARYNPGMRWVILLREPAERAWSHHRMERDLGRERLPLWLAILLERWRIRNDPQPMARGSRLRRYSYRARGAYAGQLDTLLSHFPREQVRLLRSQDLRSNTHATVCDVCAFLGLPAPPGGIDYAPVFVGGALPPDTLTMRWLRWLMRGERADLLAGYGIRFD